MVRGEGGRKRGKEEDTILLFLYVICDLNLSCDKKQMYATTIRLVVLRF